MASLIKRNGTFYLQWRVGAGKFAGGRCKRTRCSSRRRSYVNRRRVDVHHCPSPHSRATARNRIEIAKNHAKSTATKNRLDSP